jgi:hypothetical protein
MALAMNYSELAGNCLRWAETAETHDAFEAFLALAEIWRRIEDLEHRTPAPFWSIEEDSHARLILQDN